MSWEDLSIKEKSDLMRLYISNGIMDLDTIKEHYNSFQDGGNVKMPRGYKVSSKLMKIAQRQIDKDAALQSSDYEPDNGMPQATFLMNRKNQQKAFEQYGYTRLNNNEYGPVTNAVANSTHKDIPVYQKYPDVDVDRGNLQKIGTFLDNASAGETDIYKGPQDSYLPDPAYFPVDVYIDRKTGKVYNQGWDFNDYHNTGKAYGTSRLKNIAGNLLDRIGSPTVVTTGLQAHPYYSAEADDYIQDKTNGLLHYEINPATGDYEIMLPSVTVTAKRTNPVSKSNVELRPASELNEEEFWDMMEANSKQNGGHLYQEGGPTNNKSDWAKAHEVELALQQLGWDNPNNKLHSDYAAKDSSGYYAGYNLKPVIVSAKHPYHDIWGEENSVPADLNTPEKWQNYRQAITNVQERPDYKGVQTFMNTAALSPLLPILGPEALSFGKEALLGTIKTYTKPMVTAMFGLAGYEGVNNLSLEGTGNTFDYNLAKNIVHSEPTSDDILAASFLNPGWYFGSIENTAAKGVNSILKSFESPFLTQRTPNTLTRVIGSGTTGLEDAVIKAGYIRGNPNGGITTAKQLNRRYLPKLKQTGASQGLYDRFASNALTEKDYEWLHKNMPKDWFIDKAPVEESVISLNRGILPQTYKEYLQTYRSNNPQRTNVGIRTGEGLTSEDIAYNWAGENEPTFAVSKDIAKEMGYDYENILNNSLFRGDYAVQIRNARTHGVPGNNFPTGAHLDEHWSLKYPIEWNNPDVSFYKAHRIPFTKKRFYTKINPLKELGIEQAYQEGMNPKIQGSSIWRPTSEADQKTYDFLAKPILAQIVDPSSSFKIPNTLYQSGVDYIERGISPEVRNIVETQVKPRLLTEDTRFKLAEWNPSYAREFNDAINETVKNTEVSEWSEKMMEDYNRIKNVSWGGFSLNNKPRVIIGKNSSMPVSTIETHELRHQLQKSVPRTPTEYDVLKEAYGDVPQPRKGDGSINESYNMSQEWETMNTEARKILLEKTGYKYDATKSLEENVIEQDRILENYKNSDLVRTLYDNADEYWRSFIDKFRSKSSEEKRAKVAAWKKAMQLVGASTGIVGTGVLSQKQ